VGHRAEKVSENLGFNVPLDNNRSFDSFQRRIFPDSQLHWYRQPKTMKPNVRNTRNAKENRKKLP